ncbi:hypothetical protein CYLTODRAFT_426860 [Cylindrobasidium torrendii FP15055 ss-10]|uniref:Uncharacterized protein n=1 Tax=Cylindrobasidium torrendii FP15055 ss-10 TaxID=1314674 RepID=A0A0D7AZ04_9AGAR|nr:hypothetical protein CYLTODRAFT_426860 [Cylindrobasidium torrendii FP15055 ss-10]
MRIRGKIPANSNLNRVKLPIEFYVKTARRLPEATQPKHDIHHNRSEVPTSRQLKRKRSLEGTLSDEGSSDGSSDGTLVDESATQAARKAKRFCASSPGDSEASDVRPTAVTSKEKLKPDWKRLAATYIPKRFHDKEPWECYQSDAHWRGDGCSRREISVSSETQSSNLGRAGSQRKPRKDEIMKDYRCEVKECEYSLTRCTPPDVRQRKIDAHRTAHRLWKEEGWVLPGLRRWYKIVET